MSYAPYGSYKDSGDGWLGSVPSDWRVAPLSRLLTVQSGEMISAAELCEDGFPVVGGNGVRGYTSRFNTPANTIVIGRVGAKCGCVHYIKQPFWASEHAFRVRKRAGFNDGFMTYFLEAIDLNRFAIKTAQPLLNTELVVSEHVAVPPSIEEQSAIANFLDREAAKIDTLIDKQEQLIKLLEEKRQAVISHAVTKGLNPDVRMKDSGIQWLGKVPEHWGVKRLRFLCDVTTGDKDTVNARDDGVYPFFVRSQFVEHIDSYTADCEAVLTAGDGAGVGKVFHYFEGKFDFHQRVYMLSRFREVKGRFLFHFLKEFFFRVALEGNAKSTVDSLRMPIFMNFPLTVPPSQEQEHILRHVQFAAEQFDKLIDEAMKGTDLLKERRTALISAAVTGKIDVRNAV